MVWLWCARASGANFLCIELLQLAGHSSRPKRETRGWSKRNSQHTAWEGPESKANFAENPMLLFFHFGAGPETRRQVLRRKTFLHEHDPHIFKYAT